VAQSAFESQRIVRKLKFHANSPGPFELSWDALLFDFDGVLADTEPLHYSCWRELLSPFGIQLDWDFYQRNCVGVSDRMMVERLASERTPPIPWEEIWPEYQRKQLLFRERLMADPPFLEGTLALVRELAADYRLAVVSSSSRTEVEPPLERAGIRGCFQAFVCGREVANLKPAPDPYLKAAELLGARRPLVIEDSDAGVASGNAAGFEVLRVSRPERVPEEVRALLARPQFVQS
jgi:beta-phosphoglucomutase